MHLSSIVLLAAATVASAQATFNRSSKRGLVFVPNSKYVSDNQVWVENDSDLTWYYNYGVTPSAAYANRSQDEFEFVPMLWTTSNTFLSTVKGLISGGRDIKNVLTYNEPDGTSATGGSQLDPAVAAQNWIDQVQPLKELGVRLGAPACTGSPSGLTWLQSFFSACVDLGTNCTADFIPIHWYDNFEGLASHIGQIYSAFNDTEIWVTEYAYSNQSLYSTQDFFNTSAQYFDRLDYVERYSYFGSFRSDYSNVGPNVAMLTQNGALTDIGSWYLGGAATNNIPSEVVPSSGIRVQGSSWIAAVVGLVGLMILS